MLVLWSWLLRRASKRFECNNHVHLAELCSYRSSEPAHRGYMQRRIPSNTMVAIRSILNDNLMKEFFGTLVGWNLERAVDCMAGHL